MGLQKILLHVDAAQAVGKTTVDSAELWADYISIAGHKFYGPRIGALFKRETAPVYPIMYGGEQEFGLRPGTENTALIAGLGEAAKLVFNNLETYKDHMTNIRDYLEKELVEKLGSQIKLNFISPNRLCNTTSVSFQYGIKGDEVLSNCETLIASVGAACHSTSGLASRVISEILSTKIAASTIRISVGRDTSIEEIDRAIQNLQDAVEKIKPVVKVNKPVEQTKIKDENNVVEDENITKDNGNKNANNECNDSENIKGDAKSEIVTDTLNGNRK